MIIDFSRAVEGEFYTIDETLPLSDGLTGSLGGRFNEKAALKGWYTYTEGTLAVDCVLEVEAEFDCGRCGVPAAVKLKIPVRETYFKDKPDEFCLTYTDEMIDLQPVIDDRVILAMPTRVLCRNDCKGLCPKCGENLNLKQCKCNIDNGDTEDENPFAVLKNMNIDSGGATNGSTKK